jgi:hypothetical protein
MRIPMMINPWMDHFHLNGANCPPFSASSATSRSPPEIVDPRCAGVGSAILVSQSCRHSDQILKAGPQGLGGHIRLFHHQAGGLQQGLIDEATYKYMTNGLISLNDMTPPVPPMSKFVDASYVQRAWR